MKHQRLTRFVLSLFFTGIILTFTGGLPVFRPSLAQAVGDLKVNWGVPEGNPIFVLENMAPGKTITRTVSVTNTATLTRYVGIRGRKTEGTGQLENAIGLTLRQGNTDIYGGSSNTGPRTLKQFFEESSTAVGIPLSLLPGKQSTSYTMVATFLPTSGNEYQNTRVKFNLIIGLTVKIPPECKMTLDIFRVMYGTEKNDRINGTQGNDLIISLEGNDRVTGNGGEDCIVGGLGTDTLEGGPNDDVLFGNDGNDILKGGANDDTVFGGFGNDNLYGEHGDDTLNGQEGADNIWGGDHDDIISGGDGNDIARGENGNDTLSGNLGDDTLMGGNNEDILTGNEGRDTLNGEKGTDRCDGETELNCEF